MKAKDIQCNHYYKAKVSGKVVTVRVNDIVKTSGSARHRGGTSYYVENMVTGRKTVFHSAMKFRYACDSFGKPLPVEPETEEEKAKAAAKREKARAARWRKTGVSDNTINWMRDTNQL